LSATSHRSRNAKLARSKRNQRRSIAIGIFRHLAQQGFPELRIERGTDPDLVQTVDDIGHIQATAFAGGCTPKAMALLISGIRPPPHRYS
jgi:hypothetical protein